MIDTAARRSPDPAARRRRPAGRLLGGLAASCLIVLAVAGCGEDDGAAVRETASASGSGGASGSGSGSGTAPAECAPVGTELEESADRTVEVELADYAFVPATIDVPAGVTTFVAENTSEAQDHELAFLPGGGEVPLTDDGAPDEEALEEAGAFELEAFGPGQTCNATYDLEPGTYAMFCIVTHEDGETHLVKGMQGTLTVT